MALFGEVFGAEEALSLGLVDQVAPRGEGMHAANLVVARLKERSPQATALTKMLVNAAEGEERERLLEALAGRLAAGSAELAEGLSAFRTRRLPDPKGE
jgi:enoyl-CoA hydratase/carnithine racemase